MKSLPFYVSSIICFVLGLTVLFYSYDITIIFQNDQGKIKYQEFKKSSLLNSRQSGTLSAEFFVESKLKSASSKNSNPSCLIEIHSSNTTITLPTNCVESEEIQRQLTSFKTNSVDKAILKITAGSAKNSGTLFMFGGFALILLAGTLCFIGYKRINVINKI